MKRRYPKSSDRWNHRRSALAPISTTGLHLRGSALAAAVFCGAGANAAVLVNLDATALPEGALSTWRNTGTMGGSFASAGTAAPNVVTQAGVKAVGFTGAANHFLGPVAPEAVTGAGPRTIEAWVYNPEGADFETIVAWGRREGPDNTNSGFGHGVQGTWGAFGGWGAADLDWAGKLAFGRWNYVVYTYDGATSSVYSDGALANSEDVTLNTWAVDNTAEVKPLPFRLGAQNLANGTVAVNEPATLAMARVRVHDTALTADAIAAKFQSEKGDFGYNDDDNDGLPNAYERQYGDILNPNDAADAARDPDNDGLTTLREFTLRTVPNNADTDGDGANDGAEVNRAGGATDPLRADSDGDGMLDGAEATAGTNPLLADTDSDGFADFQESIHGSNPNSATSTPNITRPLIELDATALNLGALAQWQNTGVLPGNFATSGSATPSVVSLTGVKGVNFTGAANNFIGPSAPGFIAGAATRTIEAWVYNPAGSDFETVVAWGRRGGGPDNSNGAFGHGVHGTWGAYGGWGAADLDWQGKLSFGRWNYIVYTYDGTTSSVFADGTLANSEDLVLATHATDSTGRPLPFRLGAQNLASGGIETGEAPTLTVARLRVHDRPLTPAEIQAKYLAEAGEFGLIDFDNDGLPTGFERQYPDFLNPNNAADAARDQDGDGLTNLEEYTRGTVINNPDSDGDGLNDGAEITRTTNPLAPDSDGDGLTDSQETSTNPTLADSDSDGFADGQEVFHGSNPALATSTPNLATPVKLVDLNASGLASGPLASWPNAGMIQHPFTAGGTPSQVETVAGVKAVTLDGTQYYFGSAAPGFIGDNAPRTVDAWIYNPAAADEETIFAWGRRGGPDGSNVSINHGANAAFGAVGHWGAPDIGWNGRVVTGAWTHVAYTYDPATTTVSVYSNGTLANSEVLTAPLATHSVNNAETPVPLRFLLGAQNDASGNPTGGLRGSMSIARLRVYDGLLGADAIGQIHSSELPAYNAVPPTLLTPLYESGADRLTLRWSPVPATTYRLEAGETLGDWTPLATGLTGTNHVIEGVSSRPARYFRLRGE
jgi:hypothetical protein